MRAFSTYVLKFGIVIASVLLLLLLWHSVSLAQGGGNPILVVVNDSFATNRFGRYLGEILRAEGLNSFDIANLGTVTGTQLDQYDLVILAETTLSGSQASMFTTYVNGGGRLLAMRPDSQITGLFGLGSAAAPATLTDGYLSINPSASINGSAPGQGLTSQTLQIHGVANQYNLAGGAIMVARLYSNATTQTNYPAVVSNSTGRAVAFTYDLARNVVHTRQGNPANANLDMDNDTVTRTVDLFQGGWLNLDKVPLPQADIQQRLFARLVKQMVGEARPMPQLWYFPGVTKTMLILTGDAHSNPEGYYTQEITSINSYGGKITIYGLRGVNETLAQTWRTQGHSFGIHPPAKNTETHPCCSVANLEEGYEKDIARWEYTFSPSPTIRHHQVAWLGWTDAADLAVAKGVRLDTNFYHWGAWLQKPDDTWPHGYITGSGQPMKFMRADGTILPLYQQLTQLVDEHMVIGTLEALNATQATAVSQQLINASQAGDYAALMTQFHVDYYGFGGPQVWAEGTMDYANDLDIPIWNADQWLNFTETRHDANYTNIAWNSGTRTLSFNLSASTLAGTTLSTLLPLNYGGNALQQVTVDGQPASYSVQTITGQNVAFVSVSPGNHAFTAVYGSGGIAITETGGNTTVTEGGATDTYQIELTAAPTATVTINFNTGSQISPITAKTFTTGNWSTPQTVTVSAVNDTVIEGVHSGVITHTVSSADPDYSNFPMGQVNVTINDNDSSGMTITESGGNTTVTEGGATDTYQIVLTAAPTATVTINFNTGSQISPITAKSFTTVNWSTPQTVTVSAADDAAMEGAHTGTIVHTATSADPAYNNISLGQVNVTINDNDTPSPDVLLHTSFTDFSPSCAALNNTYASTLDGGTVILAGTLADQFNGSALDSSLWVSGNWSGTNTPSVAGGILTVPAGVEVRSQAAYTYTYGTFEAIAEFSPGLSQHIGFGSNGYEGSRLFLFSTDSTTNTLFARVNNNVSEQAVNLGNIPTGMHHYRIQWSPLDATNDQISFYMDGELKAQLSVVHAGAVGFYAHLSNAGAGTLRVEAAHVVPPYRSSGSYTSCVLDAGAGKKWGLIRWGATLAGGTGLVVETRTSDNGSDFTNWTAASTSSGSPLANEAQFAQYRLSLTTSNNSLTPLVNWVSLEQAPPDISISDTSVVEGSGVTSQAVFTVTMSKTSDKTVTVNYATINGSAVAPADYTAQNGMLTFAPGTTQKAITITVQGDLQDEIDETFVVSLTNAITATIVDGQATGTILDNDNPPNMSINDVSLAEGNSGVTNFVFTVTLAQASGKTITATYTTANGSAVSPADYTAQNGTLTFAPGTTQKAITITVQGELQDELDESFVVNLTNATNATLFDPQGSGTILNDDNPPNMSINNISVVEGNSGTKNAVFSVTLSEASGKTITATYTTGDGSAVAPTDYISKSGTLTFAAGVKLQQVNITINGDTDFEPNETFNVTLSNVVNALLFDNEGQATIVDDDSNQPPVANAGLDRPILVGGLVTLDGSNSYDPEAHTPLEYGWRQTGGTAVLLSSPVISRPTFTAPGTPAVLTFTLVVTDSLGLPSNPDTVVVTVGDKPIIALFASNSSPTLLGSTTVFTANQTGGTNVTFKWNFGDGQQGTGQTPSHKYAATGVYTATVTAQNGASTLMATTVVTIKEKPGTQQKIYLPLILR